MTSKVVFLSISLIGCAAQSDALQETDQKSTASAPQPNASLGISAPADTGSIELSFEQKLVSFSEKAFPKKSAKWGSPVRGRPVVIPVCWEAPSMNASYAAGRATVKNAATEQWQKNSLITFSGWEKCISGARGIRILVNDTGPHAKGLGTQIDGKRNGMVLNFTYNKWPRDPGGREHCQKNLEYCNSTIAVHEFGHALFYAHEQNRKDTRENSPDDCYKRAQGTDGDTTLTPWDPDSVMNYCNEKYGNHGILSKLDKESLHYWYGKPS